MLLLNKLETELVIQACESLEKYGIIWTYRIRFRVRTRVRLVVNLSYQLI